MELLGAFAVILPFFKQKPSIKVLDWGGELGCHYQLFHNLFPGIVFDWTILETELMCKYGNKEFATEQLRFMSEHDDGGYDIVVASGVLQYINGPVNEFNKITNQSPKFIIFNRLPFIDESQDSLTVQYVPPSIYNASYPVRFFAREKWYSIFQQQYAITFQWLDDVDVVKLDERLIMFEGLLLKNKQL
jgi:putative methyltransferase (TIGR04325 family)